MTRARILLVAASFVLALTAGCHPTTWSERDQSNMLDLRHGVKVDLTRHDGVTERGYYIGTRTMEFAAYVPRYHASVGEEPACARLPLPGEHITFTTRLNDRFVWEGTSSGSMRSTSGSGSAGRRRPPASGCAR